VLTSSCAAIYGDNSDLTTKGTGVFTEKDWNKTSSLWHKPYAYSKTMAEKRLGICTLNKINTSMLGN